MTQKNYKILATAPTLENINKLDENFQYINNKGFIKSSVDTKLSLFIDYSINCTLRSIFYICWIFS